MKQKQVLFILFLCSSVITYGQKNNHYQYENYQPKFSIDTLGLIMDICVNQEESTIFIAEKKQGKKKVNTLVAILQDDAILHYQDMPYKEPSYVFCMKTNYQIQNIEVRLLPSETKIYTVELK